MSQVARFGKIAIPMGATPEMRQLITHLNRQVTSLREEVRTLQRNPKFSGPIDMQGHRVTNVGRTEQQTDLPNRGELIDKAMYDDGTGKHIARSPIIATSGIRSKRYAKEQDELVTLRMLQDSTGSGGGGNFVTTDTFQTISGHKDFTGSINFNPVLLTGLLNGNTNHNVSLGAGTFFIVRSGPSGNFGITGFTTTEATRDGRVVIIYNATAFNMTLVDSNFGPASAVPNQIKTLTSGQANLTTTGNGMIWLIYDSAALRWVVAAANL